MMTALSALWGTFTGASMLRWLIYPALFAASLVGTHTLWENYKDGLRNEGDRRCTARYEQQIRDEERGVAAIALQKERGLLEGERKINGELYDEIERIAGEYNALRAQFDPDTSDRCLSDSVYEKLGGPRRDAQDGSKPARAKDGAGAAAGTAEPSAVPQDRPRRKKGSAERAPQS